MNKNVFLDPKKMSDEELKPFFNELNKRRAKNFRDNHPEAATKAQETYWKNRLHLKKEVTNND